MLDSWPQGVTPVTGPYPEDIPGLVPGAVATMTPMELSAMLDGGGNAPLVVDLAPSPQYRKGHIPGAWFVVRAQLSLARGRLPGAEMVVFTSPDSVLATLAAQEAPAAGFDHVRVLGGGTDAWRAAGLALEAGDGRMASNPTDVFPKPYDHPDRIEQHMRDYLEWEVNLVDQIRESGETTFRVYPE